MTRALVSVSQAQECALALSYGVDVIDFKNPQQGALGALPQSLIRDLVQQVQGRALTSATLGDYPPYHDAITQTLAAMAGTGVDYLKLAMLDIRDWENDLQTLLPYTQQYQLIAVLLAGQSYPQHALSCLAKLGFVGVMWDTQDKSQGDLLHYFTIPSLQTFIAMAQQHDLMVGLAGSLQLTMWSPLRSLQPDFLGFRGGLCQAGRASALCPDKLAQLMHLAAENSVPVGGKIPAYVV